VEPSDDPGLARRWLTDGPTLLTLCGLLLFLAGAFGLFLALSGAFLPHDVRFLGMTAEQLCQVDDCRIVRFMVHDRAAFGGTLIAVGILYAWLAEFPLRAGERWAWWAFAVSGALGFGSFVAYLGYGYLDTWHGVATLLLLPLFVAGLVLSRRGVARGSVIRLVALPTDRARIGRALLALTGFGMLVAGVTILTVGTSVVFVPQDLAFMGLQPADLRSINQRLIPLIAHDRAGFGGGIATTGLLVITCVVFGRPSRALWESILVAGMIGFGAAIGIHFVVGYRDISHVGPAILGAAIFAVGIACYPRTARSIARAATVGTLEPPGYPPGAPGAGGVASSASVGVVSPVAGAADPAVVDGGPVVGA
jgi:hypothetical protein